jgi:hypothetical protein
MISAPCRNGRRARIRWKSDTVPVSQFTERSRASQPLGPYDAFLRHGPHEAYALVIRGT